MPGAPLTTGANMIEDTLLITYADLWHADHLLPHLIPIWKNIRLAVDLSTPEAIRGRLTDWAPFSQVEITRTDFHKAIDCERVLNGVTAVFYTGLQYHPREAEMAYNVIDAAVVMGVKHFVYCSTLHPELRKLPTHETKRNVEEYLTESRLKYTILQPSCFMETFPIKDLLAAKEVKHLAFRRPDVAFSHTSTDDFVQAISVVLEEREVHFYATYQLVSTFPPRTHKQILEMVCQKLGKGFKVTLVPFEMYMKGIQVGSEAGANGYSNDAEQRFYLYVKDRGLVGNPNVTGYILRRQPTQWEPWIEQMLRLLA